MGLGKESETVEFIDDMGQLGYGLKSMVAMLNRYNHCDIYVGVDTEGNVLGLEITDDTVETIRHAVQEKVHRQPVMDITVEESDNGKKYIRMSVKGYEIPYSFENWFYARTYCCEHRGEEVITKWNATLTCAMKRH